MSTEPTLTEFVTLRPPFDGVVAERLDSRGLHGTEVFMDDVRPRTERLAADAAEWDELVDLLTGLRVSRVHASYWASPTSFLGNVRFAELVQRFEDVERLRQYYGDLSGRHMLTRWVDEYRLARLVGARSYVFHLIDYHPVDGEWDFTISRDVVLEAMSAMVQQFLRELDDQGLLSDDGPLIELENAGWGLEFGAQTADDFDAVLDAVWDAHGLLRVGWDLNHLLHAIGIRDGEAAFLLPEAELTPGMRWLEASSEGDIRQLAERWIATNVLDPRLAGRVGAVHVSDCAPNEHEYFSNGKLQPAFQTGGTWDDRKDRGLQIVLEHYDSHLPLGDGALDPEAIADLIRTLAESGPFMVLHELKNSTDVWADIDDQRRRLWSGRRPTRTVASGNSNKETDK